MKTADKWQNNAKNFEGALVMKATLRWAQLSERCKRRQANMYGPQNTWWKTQLQRCVPPAPPLVACQPLTTVPAHAPVCTRRRRF